MVDRWRSGVTCGITRDLRQVGGAEAAELPVGHPAAGGGGGAAAPAALSADGQLPAGSAPPGTGAQATARLHNQPDSSPCPQFESILRGS